mmetsp:Transcript_27446/g.38710  ORF Transcript_27446/g.38710 Transcript_27446/m.38710 type:complete len:430 (-) Transcript_27446:527-1816(-)
MTDNKAKIEELSSNLERVSKKQKTCYSKTLAQIDNLLEQIAKCKASINPDQMEVEGASAPTPVSIAMTQFNKSVKDAKIVNSVSSEHKDYYTTISKYGKVIDKSFTSEPPKLLFEDKPLDTNGLNQIIAMHLFREGKFNIGETFLSEANVKLTVNSLQANNNAVNNDMEPQTDVDTPTDVDMQEPATEFSHEDLREQFMELYSVVAAIDNSRNLQPALEWAAKYRSELEKRGNALEFKLHRLNYLHLLLQLKQTEALHYARKHFAPFSNIHIKEIQRLMACLLYVGRLESSPYKDMVTSNMWLDISHDFSSACCSVLGLSMESPLYTSITAGSLSLPKQLKVAAMMQSKQMKFTPVEVELGKPFQFHSIFACPVSREQSTSDNPPMRLYCGHVLAKSSLMRLSKNGTSRFKCPYCPTEQPASKATQVIF